jgi:hypothetical protein
MTGERRLVFFVDACYCGVDMARRNSADFGAPGQIEPEPFPAGFPDKLILALSLLVSGLAAGLVAGRDGPARFAWIRRSGLVVSSLTPPASGVLTPVN